MIASKHDYFNERCSSFLKVLDYVTLNAELIIYSKGGGGRRYIASSEATIPSNTQSHERAVNTGMSVLDCAKALPYCLIFNVYIK